MDSTPIKKKSLRYMPKGKTFNVSNEDSPKKVRFSVPTTSSRDSQDKKNSDRVYKAEDVLSMLNDSSLSDLESSSDEEWIVTKPMNKTSRDSSSVGTDSVHADKCLALSKKEKETVSPLKLLRKPEYEVNKKSSSKKSECAVSPIVIKRKTDGKKNSSTSVNPLTPSSKCNTFKNDDKDTLISSKQTFRPKPMSQDESDEENDIIPHSRKSIGKKEKKKSNLQDLRTPDKKIKDKRLGNDLEDFEARISNLNLQTPIKKVVTEANKKENDAIKLKTPKSYPSRKKVVVSDSDVEMDSEPQPKQKTPKRATTKEIIVGPEIMETEPLPKLRTPKRAAAKTKAVLTDSEKEMDTLLEPKIKTPKRTTSKTKVYLSDSENEMDTEPQFKTPLKIKERTIEENIGSKTNLRTPKRIHNKKPISSDDSDFELSGLPSPPKRRSLRTPVPKANSPLTTRKSNRKSTQNKIYKEDSDISSPDIKRTPRQSKIRSNNFYCEESDFSSPEIKKTPMRSIKIRESVVDSPSLRRQVLTPKVSARKKLEMASPLSGKKVGSGFLSPVVQERARRNLLGTPSSLIDETRASLHTSNIPKSLPCREKEFDNVFKFLSRKIEDKAGGCMYISGVPGTGKTATVHAVIRSLQDKAKRKDIPKFDFVEINGLRLTEPRQAYTRVWNELSGEKMSAEQALKALEKKFTRSNKSPTVILVDELDYLCNRRQDVIYNFLEWSTKSSAALTVLTIANTMDLPERTLKGKVTSRMGLTRLVFQPYTFQQLQQIVMNRIGNNSSFHVDAVQLVARKVAAVSGDARRALDICRRVTEMIASDDEIIKVSHIEKAITQIFSGTRVLAIKKCSQMGQFLLRAMRDEFQRAGVEETTVGQVYPQFSSICAFEGCEAPNVGVVLSLSTIIADSGLILAEKSRADLNRKLSLNVSADDIFYACNA